MGFCRLSIWCSTESELTLEKGENEKKGGKGEMMLSLSRLCLATFEQLLAFEATFCLKILSNFLSKI